MASNKRSARQRQRAEFEAQLGGMDEVFGREKAHQKRTANQREVAMRRKACTSKNRYGTKQEARDAIVASAAYGRTGLSPYRCPYCGGWHLTSHPRPEADD